jgi:hypothetical protein
MFIVQLPQVEVQLNFIGLRTLMMERRTPHMMLCVLFAFHQRSAEINA